MENFNPNAQDMERIVNIPDNTPSGAIERWEKAIAAMTSGYEDSAGLDVVFQRSHNDMVISSGIAFSSICEHHLFPFFGTADVAYVPNGRIVGLSKLARTVDVFSRRFQTQEKLADQIARHIRCILKPKGVAVLLTAKHTCQQCRGIKSQAEMKTPVFLDCFTKKRLRKEFLGVVKT